MPRDATLTRERLLRAAERRFARDGVSGARLRDVVREAGQANDAAVGYHFGSRDGLLGAIIERHVQAMEQQRETDLADLGVGDVAEVVRMIVEPTAALLRTPEGRDFLRIAEQLAGWSGVRSGRTAAPIRGTAIARQLRCLEALLVPDRPRSVARERTALLVTFLTAALAERARTLEAGRRPALGHRRYVEQLVAMLAAAAMA